MMSMKQKISIGIIGAGGLANRVHLPALKDINNAEIVAICDILEERAIKSSVEYSIPHTYTLYRDMIVNEKLDAVYVLVQPDQTFRIALECMNAGLHVFLEKPPGITTFQAETLMRKSKEMDKIAQVGFNRRYIPLVQHVLKIMKETTEITQVEGCFIKHDSAAFYSGCASSFECDTIHVIDLVRWISGGEPIVAATVKGMYNSEVINAWNSVIRFDNGVTGIIKANYQTGGRVHNFEIHGPKASAFINLGFGDEACDAEILFFGGKGTYSISSAGPGTQKRLYIDGMELAGSTKNYKYYGFYQEDVEFIECIRSNKNPLVTIEDAVKTMKFIDLLNNSII